MSTPVETSAVKRKQQRSRARTYPYHAWAKLLYAHQWRRGGELDWCVCCGVVRVTNWPQEDWIGEVPEARVLYMTPAGRQNWLAPALAEEPPCQGRTRR